MGIVVAVVFQSVERIHFSSGCVMADKYAGLGSPVGLDDKPSSYWVYRLHNGVGDSRVYKQ